MVKDLTEAEFRSEISQKTPIIVDFWASWCMPCRMMAPVFEELSKEYEPTKLKFAKLNTEANMNVPSEVGISGIPCLVIFKEGKEVDRIVGYGPKDAIKDKIDSILNSV